MNALKQAMADEGDSEVPVLVAPPVPVPPPVLNFEGILLSDDEPVEGPHVPGSPVPLPPPPAREPEPPLPPVPPPPDEPDVVSIVVAEDEAPAAAAAEESAVPVGGEWPENLEGMLRLHRIAGRASGSGGHNYATRLKVCCPNPDHVGCSKSRSTQLMVAELGPKAALCFLGSWLEHFALDVDEHRRFMPSLDDQRDYRARRLQPG